MTATTSPPTPATGTHAAPEAVEPGDVTEPVEPADQAREPGERLAAATAKLRTRTSLPLDRWFQLGGAVLMGVGVLAIVAGWYGVSHTARVWRQTPYLVSGGLLGLGLIIAGGVGYLAYWLTKLIEQLHRQTTVLERIEATLAARAEEPEPRRKPAGKRGR